MTTSVTVNHSFETGHRLPHLPGKCQSLHGHSWKVEVEITAPNVRADGTVAMFGDLKRELRAWIDRELDHGLALGLQDELKAFMPKWGKVFVFDPIGELTIGLAWPTVENMATLLARVSSQILADIDAHEEAVVSRVTVSETATNTASWKAPNRAPRFGEES